MKSCTILAREILDKIIISPVAEDDFLAVVAGPRDGSRWQRLKGALEQRAVADTPPHQMRFLRAHVAS